MPKYYCDYCDTYLTHDSPSVRKTHCNGRKHKENVRDYYQKWLEDQVQKLVDDTTAAFKQGKGPNNPFGGTNPKGGAAIPPPANINKKPGPPGPPPMGGPPRPPGPGNMPGPPVGPGGPMPRGPGGPMGGPGPGHMPMMGPGGPMPPGMGMRPPMGPMGRMPMMGGPMMGGPRPLMGPPRPPNN